RSIGCPAWLSFGHKYAMRYNLAKSTSRLIWKIPTLPLIMVIILVVGSTPVLARGGGHGGGHSGGHGGHSGGDRGHHGGSSLGGFTGSSIARDHFTNQNPCAHTDRISENCLSLARSRGRRFQKRLRTGLSPGLSSITHRA